MIPGKPVAFDDIRDEYAQPTSQDFALGWDVIASVVTLESSPDEATFVVRGSAMIEGDIATMLDERIVVVRKLDEGWRIAAESNRNAPGCLSERWASIDGDHRFDLRAAAPRVPDRHRYPRRPRWPGMRLQQLHDAVRHLQRAGGRLSARRRLRRVTAASLL